MQIPTEEESKISRQLSEEEVAMIGKMLMDIV
jgi:hypothetical protein